MELEPKYIRAYNETYEVEEGFIVKLQNAFKVSSSLEIIEQIKSVVDHLPIKDGYMQTISGVVKGEDPIFFKIRYMNEPDYIPIFINIYEVDVDEYLDEINNKRTITWSRQNTK